MKSSQEFQPDGPDRSSNLGKQFLAIVGCVAMIGVGGSKAYTGSYTALPEVGLEYIIDDNFCNEHVGSETVRAVRDSLQEGQDKRITRSFNKMGRLFDKYTTSDKGTYEGVDYDNPQLKKSLAKISTDIESTTELLASENNLTLVDDEPFIKRLHDLKNPNPYNLTEILNDFTMEYGFGSEISQNQIWQEKINVSFHQEELSDPNTIDIAKYKRGIESLIANIHRIPREIIVSSGIKKLKITGTREQIDNPILGQVHVAGEVDPLLRTLYLPVETVYSRDFNTVVHEFGHLLDFEQCGFTGAFSDTELSDLNPKDFVYGQKESVGKVAVTDSYGATSALEDKATLYADILNTNALSYISSEAVASKYKLLLARMEQEVPGSARYLLSR